MATAGKRELEEGMKEGRKEERKLISEDTNGEFRRRLPLESEGERANFFKGGKTFEARGEVDFAKHSPPFALSLSLSLQASPLSLPPSLPTSPYLVRPGLPLYYRVRQSCDAPGSYYHVVPFSSCG